MNETKQEYALGAVHVDDLDDFPAPKPESELPDAMDMTEAELDAEIRSYGIDPNQLVTDLFERVFQKLRDTSSELRAALEELERVKFDLEISHASEAILKQCATTLESDLNHWKAKAERAESERIRPRPTQGEGGEDGRGAEVCCR
jgi:hypothetical protein